MTPIFPVVHALAWFQAVSQSGRVDANDRLKSEGADAGSQDASNKMSFSNGESTRWVCIDLAQSRRRIEQTMDVSQPAHAVASTWPGAYTITIERARGLYTELFFEIAPSRSLWVYSVLFLSLVSFLAFFSISPCLAVSHSSFLWSRPSAHRT